ncbi:MAG: D-alanyl-D-alanine carboxypeptidase [Bacilli bacterium]|nr:D-alanyl-D-alanine carboxypeptidase [Bacilli bacterium]MBP3635551.1 D-alanyl-D-alanine carboxypeptidase [Bacilli bacterium]
MKKILRYLILLCISLFCLINVRAEGIQDVSSNNIILLNLNDNKVIYEKNADERVNIASLTKLMTMIVSIENISDFNEKILITSDMIDNLAYDLSKVGFKSGEVVTYYDLLYGTLLKSGADATDILAISISESVEEFVKLMNEKAHELGMTNTSFANTIGIEQDNHYSSARDISILLKYALNNNIFKKIFTTEHYISTNNNHDMCGPLKYLKELGMDYVKGAKTGYTDIAGLCLASISNYNNVDYLLVTIGADYKNRKQHFEDTKTIYQYYFNNYEYKKILSKNDVLIKLKTIYDDEYEVLSDKDVYAYLNKNISSNDLTYGFDGKTLLNKTIKKNNYIGKYYIEYNNEILYSKNIKSPVSVSMSLSYFLKHNILILGLILLTFILFIILMNKKRNSKK